MGKLAGLIASVGFGALLLTFAEPVIDTGSSNIGATKAGPILNTPILNTKVPTTTTSITPRDLKPISKSLSTNQRTSGVASDVPAIHPQLVACCRNLDSAIQHLSTVHSYTARWVRQIRKYGSLRDEEHVDLKIRHEPFGVHMNWLDGSQQVLYCEGLYDGKLLAHKARGFASLRPTWRLQPESRLALKNSRYPVTQLGMLRLAERLKLIVCAVPQHAKLDVEITTSEFQGRPAIRQYVKFGSPAAQPEYSESELLIDEQTMALVSLTNHGWANNGTGSELIEHYRYEQINWDAQLTDDDFDAKNKVYPFVR